MLAIIPVMIALFLGLSVSFQQGINLQQDTQSAQAYSARVIHLLGEIKSGLLQARLHENIFLLRKDTKYLALHKMTMEKLYQNIIELTKIIETGEINHLTVDILIFAVEYEDVFNQVSEHFRHAGLNENDGLSGKINAIATNIEQMILKLPPETGEEDIGALITSLQAIRRYTAGYTANNTQDYFERYQTELQRFKQVLLAIPSPQNALIMTEVEQYDSIFLQLKDALYEIKQEIITFHDSVEEIDPLINTLNKSTKKLHDDEIKAIDKQARQTQTHFFIYVALSAIFLIFILFLMWRLQVSKTKLSKTYRATYRDREFARKTLESIGDGVIITDQFATITDANPMATFILGVDKSDIIGKSAEEVLNLLDELNQQPVSNPIVACLREKTSLMASNNTTIVRKDGRTIPIEKSVSPIQDQHNNIMGSVMVFRDVTEQRNALQKIKYQATYDSLTGLVNRTAFDQHLALAWEKTKSSGVENILLYIDLDRFKVINDNCGHHAGDELLRQVTDMFRRRIRDSDVLASLSSSTADDPVDRFARIGGDEFALLLINCPLDAAKRIAEQMVKDAKEFQFIWDNRSYFLGVSIGIASMVPGQSNQDEALQNADTACLEAKSRGRGRVCIHLDDDEEILSRHQEIQWVPRISNALAEDRFVLYQQKIVSVRNLVQDEYHVEILVRLKENGELIPPGAFLPAAERYDLMVDLDRWIIEHTLSQLNELSRNNTENFTCSINLSGQSMCDEDLTNFITRQIKQYDIDPKKLCFEVTESAAIANLRYARDVITKLRDIGCRFSLDDFGSGLSSFAYLKELPVNFLKIDGNFIKDIHLNTLSLEMVKAINQVGHALGLETIAEFVENNEILQILRNIGVDYAQGFGIHIPEPLYISQKVEV